MTNSVGGWQLIAARELADLQLMILAPKNKSQFMQELADAKTGKRIPLHEEVEIKLRELADKISEQIC